MSDFGNEPTPPPFSPPEGGTSSSLTSGSSDSTRAEGETLTHEEMTRTDMLKTRVTSWWKHARNTVSNLQIRKPSFGGLSGGVLSGGRSGGFTSGFEMASLADFGQRTLQGGNLGFYGRLLTVVICAYFLADVAAIFAGRFIPEPPLARPTRAGALNSRPKTIEAYAVIFTRNLFNRKGIIPVEELQNNDPGGAPVKTTLPFNLIGTMILSDPERSIATIQDTQANQVYPVRIEDEIPGKARIIKVEPTRVIFLNLTSQRREYSELPEDLLAITPKVAVGNTAAPKTPGIEQLAPNQFAINRGEVDRALGDLNNILTQARAVPNFENGVPNGYKLFQIVPGSIYDKLGLKNGDVIAGLDGQPINDPGKAFEMLNRLKESSHMELQVKRDGRTQTNAYDIH